MKNFLRYLENRFLDFLWHRLPKKFENVKESNISYVVVPSFLLRSWKTGRFSRAPKGKVLTNKLTKEIMIFISGKDPYNHRYTIFHEHREGEILLAKKPRAETSTAAMEKFLRYAVRPVTLSKNLREWFKFHGAHGEALMDEIALAKEELTREEFIRFVKQRLLQPTNTEV